MSRKTKAIYKKEVIEEFLREEGIRYIDKQNLEKLYVCSPFVNDNDYRMTISYQKGGIFICPKSFQSGNFLELIRHVKHLKSKEEARQYISSKPYYIEFMLNSVVDRAEKEELTEEELSLIEKRKKDFLEEYYSYEDFDKEKHPEYLKYLLDRGIEENIIDRLNIKINTAHKRVVFPVYENGELVFHNGRAIEKENILRWYSKSANSDILPVFFRDPAYPTYYVFEGMFDALLVEGGVCVFGSSFSEKKARKILDKNPDKIVIVMDNDVAGDQAQFKYLFFLSQYHKEVYYFSWAQFSKDNNLEFLKTKFDFSEIKNSNTEFFTNKEFNKYIIKYSAKTLLMKKFETKNS